MDGRRPHSVTAITQHIKPEVYPRVDDEATIILIYPKAQAIIQASWNWPFDRKDMEVYGQSGYAITVRRDDIRVRRKGAEEEQLSAKAISAPNDNSLAYFKAVVNGEIPSEGLSSLETNITVTEILDAARRSAASGRTIQLSAQ
jgi:predicted dehydrogenase